MNEPEIITDLSPEKYRQEFIRMGQFVFNRETEDIRSDIHQSLIISSLYTDKENHGMTIDDIIEYTKDFLSMPLITVEEFLERMIAEHKLTSKNGKYFLTEDEKATISQIIRKRTTTSNSVYEEIISKIKERYGELTEEQRNLIVNNFQLLLAYLFTRDSTISIRTILGDVKEHILESADIEPIIYNVLASTEDKKLRGLQRVVFGEIFLDAGAETGEFFCSLAQNYISLQILNLDPECLIFQKFSLSKKEIFLDTNVIMALICPSTRDHNTVKELLNLMADLGIKAKFTSCSKKELMRSLDTSNDRYKTLSGRLSVKNFQKVVDELNDDFIKSFWIEKRSHPGLNWDGYYYSISTKLDDILTQFSIEFDDTLYEDVKSHPDIGYVNSLVLDCALRWRDSKHPEVAKRDAFHILLMKELRKNEPPSTILGPDHWFVTLDGSLYCVDKEMNGGNYPYTVRLDVWFNTLCLFMPLVNFKKKKETIEEIFMHFMSSLIMPFYRIIDADTLIGITDWIDFDSLTTEEILDITSKKFVKDYVKEVQEAREQGKEPKDNIRKIKAITKEVEEIHKKKLEKLTEELTVLKNDMNQKTAEILDLKESIDQKDTTIKEFKSYLFIAVLLLFIIIDSILYIILKNITTVEITIGIIAILITIEVAVLFGIPSIRNWIRESVS